MTTKCFYQFMSALMIPYNDLRPLGFQWLLICIIWGILVVPRGDLWTPMSLLGYQWFLPVIYIIGVKRHTINFSQIIEYSLFSERELKKPNCFIISNTYIAMNLNTFSFYFKWKCVLEFDLVVQQKSNVYNDNKWAIPESDLELWSQIINEKSRSWSDMTIELLSNTYLWTLVKIQN